MENINSHKKYASSLKDKAKKLCLFFLSSLLFPSSKPTRFKRVHKINRTRESRGEYHSLCPITTPQPPQAYLREGRSLKWRWDWTCGLDWPELDIKIYMCVYIVLITLNGTVFQLKGPVKLWIMHKTYLEVGKWALLSPLEAMIRKVKDFSRVYPQWVNLIYYLSNIEHCVFY